MYTVLQKQQEVLNSYEAKIASLSSDFSSLVSNLELSLAASFELYETVSSLNERELKQDQLKMVSVLRQQVESLQDQVCFSFKPVFYIPCSTLAMDSVRVTMK